MDVSAKLCLHHQTMLEDQPERQEKYGNSIELVFRTSGQRAPNMQ